MFKRRGYAYAMEWNYRRRSAILGRNWYSIDHKLHEFVPFTNAFEARSAEMERMRNSVHGVGSVVKSFIFKFELAIAENRKEEDALIELGSLVIFSRARFGRTTYRWKVIGSGRDFLVHFKPYKRTVPALRTLTRERSKGCNALLASWQIQRITADSLLKVGHG